ncbi:MAG: TetR/AcrR family transcriptional regulator [Acidimicrobiia bacterium]|nr:TetR/AcrR family transcriptional regulator [Acidimicrobiia bacterium]
MNAEPGTARGRETKEHIVDVAARLMHMQGVDATSLDQILAESGTGKGQMYHYFSTKTDLVEAVLRHQLQRVLADQRRFDIATWDGIERWLDSMLRAHAERGFRGGCPLGSLIAEVVDRDDRLRAVATEAFTLWEDQMAAGLRALQDRGELRDDADPRRLAEEAMATIQGGYLLSTMKRRAQTMQHALAAVFERLASFAT